MNSFVCLADNSCNMLSPQLNVPKSNIQNFFGRSTDVQSFLPIIKDINGLRTLMHRAVIEKDTYAKEILTSLAEHPVPYIRVLFVKALIHSNPKMVQGSEFWQQKILKESHPIVLNEINKTKTEFIAKVNILEGVAHNFRNKLTSIGGFLTRMAKISYAESLTEALDIAPDNILSAVALFQKDVFYKLKLELDKDETTNMRRSEILSDLNSMMLEENIKKTSLEGLEETMHMANELYSKRKEVEKINRLSLITASIEAAIYELIYEFQGSSDELVYFVVDKFALQISQLMAEIKQLQDIFKTDEKMLLYLGIMENEGSYLLELIDNLQKAIAIEDLRLQKQDLKQIVKNAEAEFREEYKDRNILSKISLVPSKIEAVISEDFNELISAVFRVADVFISKDKGASVYTTLRRGKDNAELTLEFRGGEFTDKNLDILALNMITPFTGVHTLEVYDAQSALLRMRNVVRACGGRIEVKKTPAGGIAFVLSLPLHKEYAFVNRAIFRLSDVIRDSIEKIQKIKNSAAWASGDITENDRKIVDNYENNLLNLRSTSISYLLAMISLDEMLIRLNKGGVDILTAYEELGSLTDRASYIREELQTNGMIEVSLLMNILIPSYYSMIVIDVKDEVKKMINEQVDQRINVSTNKKPTVNVAFHSRFGRMGKNIATYPNELRMLMREFIDTILQSGRQKVDIDMYLENRQIKAEIVIPFDPKRDKFKYNLSLIDAIQDRTGAVVSISNDIEGKWIRFSFSMPVTTDLKTAPIKEDVSKYLSESKKAVLVLSGLRGAKRNNSSHLLESMLGLKKINVGFWMRVITYYISKEKTVVFDQINKLGRDISKWVDNGEEESKAKIIRAENEITELIESECIPYINELFKRIDFLAEPITIDGVDTATVGKEGNLSIRDKIKVVYTNPVNRKFLYKFTNNEQVQNAVDINVWAQVRKILALDSYNGVSIIATDPKQIPQDLLGIAHNFYLNAAADVRSKTLMQYHADELMEWDRFTGKDALEMGAIRNMAYEVDIAQKGIDMNVSAIVSTIMEILEERNGFALSVNEPINNDVLQVINTSI